MKESAEPCRCRCGGRRAPDEDEDVVVVSVSLSEYFADARALSYAAVSRRRRARWLAARLARRWRLPGPGAAPARVALLLRGRLLPPGERLRALEPGDTIQVIPQGEDWFLDEDDLTSSSEDETPVQKRKISEPPTPMRHDDEHELKVQKRPQNETSDGVAIEDASSTSSVVTQSDAHDDLRALKRRALELLDHCAPPEPEPEPSPCPSPSPSHSPRATHAPGGADAGVSVARPRRRRVRRRARRLTLPLPLDPESPTPPPPPPPPPPPASRGADTTDAAAGCASPGAVLMNGAQRGDARTRPRLVRPLHWEIVSEPKG